MNIHKNEIIYVGVLNEGSTLNHDFFRFTNTGHLGGPLKLIVLKHHPKLTEERLRKEMLKAVEAYQNFLSEVGDG